MLGFVGGELGCQSTCEFDTTQCGRCAPLGGLVSACEPAPVATRQLWSLDIAASGSEFGMAWVGANLDAQVELAFARFADDLALLMEPVVVPAGCTTEVALAAVGNQWFLALTSDVGVALTVLDDDGKVRSAHVLASEGVAPKIAAGPEGALIVWGQDGSIFAVLVDESANVSSAPASLPFGTEAGDYEYDLDVARAGDGYLVAARVSAGIRLARVELDGSFAPTTAAPVNEESEYPRLATLGDEVRMTYADFSGGIGVSGPRWIRLTSAGEAAGPATVLGTTPDHYGPTAHALIADDSIVMLAGYTGISLTAGFLDAARFTGDGVASGAAERMVTDPTFIRQVHTVVVDGRVIAAWLNGQPTTIGLARLGP
jgi:hypothetical protein